MVVSRTRRNVKQLQVAWTYPFGDTGSSPIVVRGVAYGDVTVKCSVAIDHLARALDTRGVSLRIDATEAFIRTRWDCSKAPPARAI